jgi:uncharacterized protein with ATP-grasp and redox domains
LKTFLDCVPCFLKQALDAARMASADPDVHAEVLRTVARAVAEMDTDDTPPSMGQVIHRVVRDATGVEDPYRAVKDHFNTLALSMYHGLKRTVSESDDPFCTAVRLAVAGNIIDFGATSDVSEEGLRRSIRESLDWPVEGGAIDELRAAADSAARILYVGDNAGEIVFDRVLIEELPEGSVTFAVRGSPVINDVTMRDATEVGLADIVPVVENGSDAPGTILDDCSQEFRDLFEDADVVIAKGQGNYETLSQAPGRIFFVLKAKCPVIARDIGCDVGAVIVTEHRRARAVARPPRSTGSG